LIIKKSSDAEIMSLL